jgi:hypothetical protein
MPLIVKVFGLGSMLCGGAIRQSGPAAIFVVNPLFARSYLGPGSGSHPHWGWDPVC